ncbi:uncharacterized protein C4orf50 homolog [Phascolarctos cinereus]
MDASAHGGKERKFHYHVKVPTEDKFDSMNLNVKIDTSWVFEDAEDADDAYGGLSEEGAKSSEEDAGNLRKQLETSEQRLRTAVEKHVRSESQLRNRIEELELSEQKLLQRVDRLNAQVYHEENAYLQAKEKLEEIQEELTDLVEETERAQRVQREKLQQFQDQLRRKDEELQSLLASFEHYKQHQRQQMAMVREREGFLKGQVLRLEEEAQHLREATASLMTKLEAGGNQDLDSQVEVPLEKSRSEPWSTGEDLAELRAFLEVGELQARRQVAALQQSLTALLAKEESNNREKEEILRQLQEHRDTVLHLLVNKMEDSRGQGSERPREELKEQNTSLQDELGAKVLNEAKHGTPPKDSASLSKPSFVQDELLPLKWEAALDPSRSKACQTSFVPENAKGSGAATGLPAEQDCDWGSFRGMKGSPALPPTLDNLDELEEIRISDSEQKRRAFEKEKDRFFSEKQTCSQFNGESPLQDESCENEILATDIGNSRYFLKINELEKEVEKHFQEIFALEEENESYRQKMKQLEEENWRYSQQLQSLEVEVNVDTHTASAAADGGTDVDSSEILEGRAEKDVVESIKLKKGRDIRTIFAAERKYETHSKKLPDLNEIILNSQLAVFLNRFPLKTEARESMNRFFQLISDIQTEKNQVFLEITKLRKDHEICNNKTHALEEEKERNLKRIAELEQDKVNLLENLTQLRSELGQYLQLISDLEDCNGKSYDKISDLQEENMTLKKKVDSIQKVMAENIREAQEVTEQVTQENQELKALIADLSLGYKDLRKDLVPGIQDMMQSLKEENEQLLHKIHVMEGKIAWETKDIKQITEENEHLKDHIQKLLDKANLVDQGIQVTDPSGQPTRDERLSLEEASVFDKGQEQHPFCSEMYQFHLDYKRLKPFLVKENPEVSTVIQDPSNGSEDKRVDFEKKKKRKSLSEFHNRAHGSLAISSQLQDIENIAPEESQASSKLLHHQVLTLRSQLRDQAALHSELQASQSETRCLQGQLREKIEELRRMKNEVNLAVTPLKAKVASLVQKCQDRNNLVTQLVQELHRHGIENLQLSQAARALVDDVAVGTCASTFMSSDPRELPSGVMNNPRTCQIGVDVGAGLISESIQQETLEMCSLSTPPTNDLPLPSKVMSPERILALHWELSHSRYTNYQVNKSPLVLRI